MGFCSRLGESPNTWQHFGTAPTQVLNSVILVLLRQETATWGGLDLVSDGVWDRDYGWGVRVRRHFGAGGVLYGTELGSVTLKRVGLFYFPIKHSTHTQVTLKRIGFFCFPIKHSTHTHYRAAAAGGVGLRVCVECLFSSLRAPN